MKSEYEATLKVPTNVPKPISQVATPTSEPELNANNRNSKTKASENFIAKAARAIDPNTEPSTWASGSQTETDMLAS